MKRNRIVSGLVAILVIILLLAGCVGDNITPTQPQSPAPAPTPVPAPSMPQLAFAGNRNGNYALFMVNIDGSGEKQITGASDIYHPSWSPDGRLIAAQKGPSRIVIMNPDGTNMKDLTSDFHGNTWFRSPDFSPYGNLIICDRFTSPRGIATLNLGGVANSIGISQSGNMDYNFLGNPRVSPDASMIAFEASFQDKSTAQDKSIAEPGSGSGSPGRLPVITTRPGIELTPTPSNSRIGVVNFDGTKLRQLTAGKDKYDDTYPAWSPDGKKIVFMSDRTGKNQIYVMNADGTGQTQITNDSFVNHDPAWSPDGAYIAYVSDHSGISELYIIRPDGTGRTRVNRVAEMVRTPAWRPLAGKGLGGLQPPTILPPTPPPVTTKPPVTTTPPQPPAPTTGRLFISISGGNGPYNIYVNGALVGKDSANLTLPPGSYRVTIYNRSGTKIKDETSYVIAGKDSVFKVSGVW